MLAEKWKKAIEQIKELSEIKIPRCYCYYNDANPVVRIDLHGFSDSSLSAYGACVYLKFLKKNGETNISLVAAKSRVAPLKNTQTIPRLELMGNVILARLENSVMAAFQNEIQIDNVYCHTDSTISLSWVKAVQKEFQPFVQNRVNEIRQKVDPESWYYCPTDQNPADLLTRTDNDGLNSALWWEGPEFLKVSDFYSSQSMAPGGNEMVDFQKELKPQKTSTLLLAANDTDKISVDKVIDINRYV